MIMSLLTVYHSILISIISAFPSKMTAYSYKERGEKGMAAGQPMGKIPSALFTLTFTLLL